MTPAIYREPLCPLKVLPLAARSLWTTSEGITPSSSLLPAHAPDQYPSDALVLPLYTRSLSASGGLRAPAGSWPFPTLSPQSLRRCLDPYPAASLQCICSLLPEGQRARLKRQRFGTPNYPFNVTSTGNSFSGLQSFHYVQAPIRL